jgi:hypothetical protein
MNALEKFALVAATAAAAASPLRAQTPAGADTAALRTVVQRFYDWYIPVANKPGPGEMPWRRAVKRGSPAFGVDLVRQLEADAKAQAANRDEIVGLDGDPILAAQDFCQTYRVGRIVQEGARYVVEVHGICDGTRHPAPDVAPVLVRANDAWVLVNFRFPREHSDLLTVLRQLRAEREKKK